MKKLELSIALTNNPRTWPVLDGRAQPDGIDLVITQLGPAEIFWRQLKYAEFDVSEMSVSSLLITLSKGDDRWIGIPVCTTRRFFHTSALVRRDAKIESPQDLKGKRVGVPEYQQTAALWARGAFEHDFGVRPQDMEFWMERPPEKSHGGATGFKPPPGVTLHYIPAEKSIASMLLAGELDATLIWFGGHVSTIDRSEDISHHPNIRPLFPDRHAEGVRFYQKTGIFPINHTMVIRREIAEKQPWAVVNILKAFNQANDIVNAERGEQVEYYIETGLLPREARQALETPLIRHGIKANRKVLETAAQWSAEQGLTPKPMRLEDVFAASTFEE